MRVLGIDYGRSKIGLAIGESTTGLAEPYDVWPIKKFKVQVKALIAREKIEKLVVGLPGGKLDQEIKKFAQSLAGETGLGLDFADETLTTQEAQKIMIKIQKKQKIRREKEDAYAAAVMLELYLETKAF